MKKLFKAIKILFHPSVDKSLSTFNKKIDELQQRIDIDKNSIEFCEHCITDLRVKIFERRGSIAKAENAIAALELVTGERSAPNGDNNE